MQINLRTSRILSGVIAALITTGALAALAMAAPEQTRESYVAAVEPICKTNTKANERILAGAEKKIKEGKLKVAAGQFTQAAAAFAKTVKQIKAVPAPAADSAKLTTWLGHLEDEQALLSEIGKALKAEKKSQVRGLSVRLNHNANVTNNSVLGFEFNYCLIDPSKFS
jgi:hypothetical protein